MELIEKIRKHIKEHPSDFPLFQAAVNEGFAQYLDQKKNEQSALARTVVDALLLTNTYPDFLTLGYYIDVAWFLFPRGVTSHSKIQLCLWDNLIKAARNEFIENETDAWILDTRGIDCFHWWLKYVEPERKKVDIGRSM